jgi:hypothetical protein
MRHVLANDAVHVVITAATHKSQRHKFPATPNHRHPSESWDPVTYLPQKALDPSFRWDDGVLVR